MDYEVVPQSSIPLRCDFAGVKPRKSLKVPIQQQEIVDEEEDDDDSEDRLEPGIHKENPEVVDDDDDNKREQNDDEMGSLESLSSNKKFF
nr:hypothetical protein [Tanacetum cinerariifolium]